MAGRYDSERQGKRLALPTLEEGHEAHEPQVNLGQRAPAAERASQDADLDLRRKVRVAMMEVREDLIEQIRGQIRAGTYLVPAPEVASCLMGRLEAERLS